MFDDPREELARLQRELVAAQQAEEEDNDEDTEDLVDVPDEDADRVLAEVKQMLAEDEWEEQSREPLDRRYIPYDEPEPTASRSVPVETRADRKQSTASEREAAKAAKPRYGCLLTVLALETLGLIVMAAWWYLWLK